MARAWNWSGVVVGLGIGLTTTGCIDVQLTGAESLFPSPSGTPFIVRGTATVVDSDGPCPVWVGDNGVTYHLFQNPLLDNATFDRITTSGVISRLQLSRRTDLVVACQIGTIAEVDAVLEIVE
jgi:hypothetical protein